MADFGLGSWPHRRARIDPDRPAFRQGDRELTYRQLADRVQALAGALAAAGVRPGDRIAYLAANSIAGFETFFAAGRLGAIFAPLNTRLTTAELAYLVQDCVPSLLVYDRDSAQHLSALAGPGSPVRRTLGLGDDGPEGYEAFLLTGLDQGPPETDVGLDDDAVILYTSGTTGRPKGAVLTHGNLTFNTMNQLAHADVLRTDTALAIAPLFHASGLGQVSLPTLFKGGRVAVLPRFDPAAVLEAIGSLKIASFGAVPTMLQLLCDHPAFAGTDLGSLRYVIYGGSMVAERVAVAWQRRGVVLLQGYGMTEASPGVHLASPDGATERPTSIGSPHFFTDVAFSPLGDSDSDRDGQSGELLVRGLNVFRGYWNRPDDTARALADGWFHSGDVVRVDDDGWAYVVDRIKDMIISGGENIYPAEVEAQINSLPGIIESAVIAVPDDRWGEVGLALIVSDPDTAQQWDASTLREALAGQLAAYKIPKHVQVVESLPKTVTGKVRKQDLRQGVNPR
ncbi:MAG TPA: long-chain fatty acid--CoA ligase [Streptosporangiaceae bacterium]|nr:long-chain fatty acid--CoA ligase [Streptosporangiaceae bacterium]